MTQNLNNNKGVRRTPVIKMCMHFCSYYADVFSYAVIELRHNLMY